MLRSTFLIFNVLLTGVLYALACTTGFKQQAATYTVTYFSIPYILLNFAMAAYCLARWFMKQDHEIADTGITFLHNIWLTALFTFIAYELTGTDILAKALEYVKAHI
jgi:hypothetical protein